MASFYQSFQSLFIPAPADKIFSTLTDWSSRSLWRKGIQVDWQGSPQAFPGQEVAFLIKDGLFRYRIRFKVTGLEPPHRLYMEYFGKPLEGRHAVEITPQDGGCQVDFHWMKVRPVGLAAKLYFVLGFGMRDHERRTQETLEMLKTHLEKN